MVREAYLCICLLKTLIHPGTKIHLGLYSNPARPAGLGKSNPGLGKLEPPSGKGMFAAEFSGRHYSQHQPESSSANTEVLPGIPSLVLVMYPWRNNVALMLHKGQDCAVKM